MIAIFYVLQTISGEVPSFERGGIVKAEGLFINGRDKTPKEAMTCIAQGSSKCCLVCSSACLLTTFLEIYILDFFNCG